VIWRPPRAVGRDIADLRPRLRRKLAQQRLRREHGIVVNSGFLQGDLVNFVNRPRIVLRPARCFPPGDYQILITPEE
jgi:hypothetical protein